MTFSKYIYPFILLIVLLLSGCRKDLIINEQTPKDPELPTVRVESGVLGRVFDENSEPVLNASVELAGQIIETDSTGVFYFNHLDLDEGGDFIQVEKQGYFSGSRRFYPTLGNENYVEIKLLPKKLIGTIDAAAGGILETSDGFKIDLPSNGIIDEDGNTFTGEVNVFANFINPTADDLAEIMPGDLVGRNNEGTNVVLETYGMVVVELESPSGVPLNIAENHKAKLTFPVPAALHDSAPSVIPLWFLDETTGLWIEEGEAIFDGNSYLGQVSHFSFWNCDAPFELVELEGCFIDENGLPLVNVKMKITNLTTGNSGYGVTDSRGCFKGKVPKDEPLKLELVSGCGVNYYSEDIGSFASSEDLGTIQVTGHSDQFFTTIVKGRIVDCAGDVIDEDMVLEMEAGGAFSYFSINGSNFEIPAEHCLDVDSLILKAIYVNNSTSEVSLPVVIYPDSSDILIGDLAICSNDMPYMRITIGDDSHTYFYSDSTAFAAIDIDPNTAARVNLVVFDQVYSPADSTEVTFVISMDSIALGDISDIADKPNFTYGNLSGFFGIRDKFWGVTNMNEPSSVKINRIGGKGGFVQGETEIIFKMWNGAYDAANGHIQINFEPGAGDLIDVPVKVEFNLIRIL